jgi:hypothetical protein
MPLSQDHVHEKSTSKVFSGKEMGTSVVPMLTMMVCGALSAAGSQVTVNSVGWETFEAMNKITSSSLPNDISIWTSMVSAIEHPTESVMLTL